MKKIYQIVLILILMATTVAIYFANREQPFQKQKEQPIIIIDSVENK